MIEQCIADDTSIGHISLFSHENRNSVFPAKNIDTADVIRMLVGYEYAPQPGQRKPQPCHPFNYLPGADAGIDKNGIIVIAKIITVAVTAGSY
jgi:hypothetical protein